MSVLSKYI